MIKDYLHPFGDKTLIFGLRWQPIVGQISATQIKLQAKSSRAKHWVAAGQTFMALGLSTQLSSTKKELYAAAVCYALIHSKGLHATLYKVQDSLYWLVASHDGTPISKADCLFTDVAAAHLALEGLVQHYPDLQYSKDIQFLTDFLTTIATRSLDKSLLQTRREAGWRILLLVFLLLLVIYGWQWGTEPVEAAYIEPEPDLYLAYWEKNSKPNGKEALQQLLETWDQLPLAITNWQFQEARCDAEKDHWLCTYRYEAQTETATAIDIENRMPTNWKVKEINLRQAWLQQQVGFAIGASRWRSAEQLRLELLSQLQGIRPAFSVLRLMDPLPMQPNSSSSVLYKPIFYQNLHFEAPLRSLVLLADFDDALHWKHAVLQYRPQVTASLKNSALQANLQGVVYVREE